MNPSLKIYPPATDKQIALMQERRELYQDYKAIGSLIERIRILQQEVEILRNPMVPKREW